MLRDAPERQRSMQAVFDHSWQLLSKEEQRALRQLSVFRGGFSREAALAVAAADLPLLLALVAKSFLRRSATGRFTMHELVRQYVAARLCQLPDEEMATLARHSAYYTEFVARLDRSLKTGQQLEALAVIDAEIDNFRHAWRWAARQHNVTSIRQPMRTISHFFDIRCWFQEAEITFGWLADELAGAALAGEELETAVEVLSAYVRAHQGWFLLRLGKLDEAYSLLHRTFTSLRQSAISIELTDLLYYIGTVAWMTGDFRQAYLYYHEELQVAEQVGEEWDIGLATGNLALLAQIVGDYEEARQRWEVAFAINSRSGDPRTLAATLHFSGILKCLLGAYAEAQSSFRESLKLSAAVGDR